MPNPWDGVSALLFKEAGFEALGTSSAALAATLGRVDGRHALMRLIAELTDLPVNGDFEDGYGESPEDVARTVEMAIGAGLAGIGIEDTSGNPNQPIRDFDEAGVKRVSMGVSLYSRVMKDLQTVSNLRPFRPSSDHSPPQIPS